jgi:LPXTG-motif cell wall-anchored protein
MKKVGICLIMMLCLCFVNTDCVYADTYSYRACHGIFKYYGKVDATCTTVGHKAYWQCFTCGRLYLDDLGRPGKRIASEYETVTSATGHSYGEPTFIWENDYSKSTASFVCKNNSSHVETKECTVSSSTTPATCLEEGKITYTATCTLDGKNYQDMQEVVIPVTGHSYGEPTFTWQDDYSKATASFICENDSSHVKTEECTVSSSTTPATCLEEGKITYTANCKLDGKNYQDTQEVVISATGHSYGEPTFTWQDDYSKATASFICENDSSHVKTEECTVSSSTTPATCLEEGKITYTATCTTFDGKNYQDMQEVVISATGHTWKDGKCTVCGEKQPVTEEKKQETKQEVKQAGTAIKATTTTAGPKSKTDTDTSSPKTGDNQEMPYIWMILLLSLGGVTGAILKRKKEK